MSRRSPFADVRHFVQQLIVERPELKNREITQAVMQHYPQHNQATSDTKALTQFIANTRFALKKQETT